jgi:hypothetical protein
MFTEVVENPVEKVGQTRIPRGQSEQNSGLHHLSAIHSDVNGALENRRIIL